MGTEQSRPSGQGEKDKGSKARRAESVALANGHEKPDLPASNLSKFSKSLLALMRSDIGDLTKLTSIVYGETYTASGKTIDSVKDGQNLSVLHAAVLAQKTPVVKFLLECGCQARTLNDSWQTALHDAIDLGNHDIVMLLLEHGAPNVCLSTNGLGELPIHTVRLTLAYLLVNHSLSLLSDLDSLFIDATDPKIDFSRADVSRPQDSSQSPMASAYSGTY